MIPAFSNPTASSAFQDEIRELMYAQSLAEGKLPVPQVTRNLPDNRKADSVPSRILRAMKPDRRYTRAQIVALLQCKGSTVGTALKALRSQRRIASEKIDGKKQEYWLVSDAG